MTSGLGPKPEAAASRPSANLTPTLSVLSRSASEGGPKPRPRWSSWAWERTAIPRLNPFENATHSVSAITTPGCRTSTVRRGTATPSSDSGGPAHGGGPVGTPPGGGAGGGLSISHQRRQNGPGT